MYSLMEAQLNWYCYIAFPPLSSFSIELNMPPLFFSSAGIWPPGFFFIQLNGFSHKFVGNWGLGQSSLHYNTYQLPFHILTHKKEASRAAVPGVELLGASLSLCCLQWPSEKKENKKPHGVCNNGYICEQICKSMQILWHAVAPLCGTHPASSVSPSSATYSTCCSGCRGVEQKQKQATFKCYPHTPVGLSARTAPGEEVDLSGHDLIVVVRRPGPTLSTEEEEEEWQHNWTWQSPLLFPLCHSGHAARGG